MLRSRQCVGVLVVIAAMTTHGRIAYTAGGDSPSPHPVLATLQDDQGELDRDAMIAEARRIRRTGDLEGAIDAWLAVHEAFPDEAAIMTSIGYLQRERGEMDRSIHWFRRAAATGQDWYNYLRLAVVYTDMGDASGMYWATQELENAAPFKGAGRCMRLLYTKDWQGLQFLAETALDDGGDPTFWREMAAYGAAVAGHVDDALAHFRADYPELFEDPPVLKPGRPTSPLWIAWLLQRKGNHDQAQALCNLVLDAIPRKPVGEYDWVYNNMFRLVAYALLGNNDEALLELRLGIDRGLRMRLFDNVVLFEDLPMLEVLHQTDEFWRLMATIYRDSARMRAELQRNT